ncbi:glucoamylase family protein [Muriicola soli]|uniref:Beta-glucosidase n=1 Tax=Muriicola soli TaxID=2507538 RepID=A0A411E6E7_9FLAO|nr:glucoamylase family protein [Muriicola soli]QBA63202.1 beta-glucosidase [Muriicola soli]
MILRKASNANTFLAHLLAGLVLLLGFYSCSSKDGKEINPDVEQHDSITQSLTEEELMDLVQQQTFSYFWDFGHPFSGMALERSQKDAYGVAGFEIVTSGGSGFGVMGLIVGVERNFITRQQAVERLHKITDLLLQGDRFHGAFPHWYYGSTGRVRPFFTEDNGGDIVETSFMIMGLLTARQYFNEENEQEGSLREKINQLWEEVEWDWYTNGADVLTWHWSPDYEWAINHQIRGYNEALITYVLAASSPTHPVDAEVYHQGWTSGSDFYNGSEYYDQWVLPLGPDLGGPLFFAHYSFLGLDPRELEDDYADYWQQNVNHTLINRAYCLENPKGYAGYGKDNWGLTASDNHLGYSAHSPTNDLGVISPTAAISSLPYTPEYAMDAMRSFYENHQGRLWGPYGFYDAFNLSENWYADNYLAIDQGPILVMIENYRTGLLWDLFMSCPEVKTGLLRLGFRSPHLN